jgi:hypothetical protein
LEEVVVLLYHAPPRNDAEQTPLNADKSVDKRIEKKKANGKQ